MPTNQIHCHISLKVIRFKIIRCLKPISKTLFTCSLSFKFLVPMSLFEDYIWRHKELLKNLLKNGWICCLNSFSIEQASLNLKSWHQSYFSLLYKWVFVTLIESLYNGPLNPTLNKIWEAKTLRDSESKP